MQPHGRSASAEKNNASPDSNGNSPPPGDQDSSSHDGKEQEEEEEEVEDENDSRTLFFNVPLPNNLIDAEGHPTVKFIRNKIRTAKYTPLSFVPKNLWFQFHNIANVFFLFLIILGVSYSVPCCPFGS